MDAVGSVLSIMRCLCTNNPLHEPLARRCKHLGRPTRKLNKLKSLMEELDARKGDINIKLEKLWLDKGMEPKEAINLWIKNVDHIKSEVSSLIDESEQRRQSLGSCYLCSRIHLGERIERMIKDTLDLLEKGQFSDDSVAEALPKRGYSLPTTTILEYGTNRRSLMRIWDLLLDHNVRRIGVYGMGGVGKTTLMIEINNHVLKECHFDSVIWVTVSKDSSLEKLQGDIAVKLGLEFSTIDDEICKAAKLFEALNRRKRLLLILDDLWEPFSLERVGVPIPTAENGRKLVITTRLLKTCRGMETNEDVEVRVLLEEGTWNLFRAKIGDQVLTSSVMEPIAKDVAKECGGLPLTIVTVGRALRNAFNISEWENALVELRASTDNIDNMDKVVFSRLLLSYKMLRDDTSRSCFLFSALYPEGHLIDTTELIAYWMWEGLLGGVVRTSESKRKVKIILNELKYACLLESADHDGVEYVKLHDMIRDMAIKIIRTSPRCIVNAGSQLTKPPGPDEWGDDVQRLSLMRNDLKFIKFSPMCSKLTSLLLQYNSFVDGIGNGFFDNMQGLKVLDLSYTGISALPESVSNLENLCALLLSHCCYLSALPTLAKLSKLMVLDLSSCGLLQELPHGMEHLNNLTHLDISSTGIEFLPFGIVSKFTLLEDPITDCSGVIWVSQRVKGIEGGACIEELISSPKLSTLSINFWNIKVFNEYAASKHWCQLNEYNFIVGQSVSVVRSSLEKKSLVLNGGFPMDKSAALILRTTVELRIAYVHSIKLLSTHLPDAMNLKRVVIMSCRHMSCVLDCEENNLPMLESLDLIGLHDMKMICKKSVRSGTLMSLKFTNVECCSKLKSLFSRQLMLELKNLEEISLNWCLYMEEVIEMEMKMWTMKSKWMHPRSFFQI